LVCFDGDLRSLDVVMMGYINQDPLSDAEITLSVKKTRNNIWIVNMKASAKGYLPGSEQFAVKLEDDFNEITD
jgi:hypothetical protein